MPKLIFCLVTLLAVSASAQETLSYTPHELGPSLRSQAEVALFSDVGEKNFPAGRTLLERWLEADPRDFRAWFMLAIAYAALGENEKAIDAFERSVDSGLREPLWAVNTKEFDPIRSDKRFQTASARLDDLRKKDAPNGFVRHFAPMRSEGSYIVMLPPDYSTSTRKYPLCLILHGNGSTELNHGKIADQLGREGVIYAAVRAPYPHIPIIVSTGRPAFSARIPDEVDNFDTSPLGTTVRTDYVDWILAVAADVQKRYRVQSGKVFLYGHSQGGQFATFTSMLHPDKIASYYAMAGSPVPDSFFTNERLNGMKREKVQVWLVHGTEDTTVLPETSVKLAERLKVAGIPATIHLVSGGHSHNEEMYKFGRQWLTEVVRGDGSK